MTHKYGICVASGMSKFMTDYSVDMTHVHVLFLFVYIIYELVSAN